MTKPPSLQKKRGRKPRVKGRQMTASECAEAMALWAAGESTIKDIANKFGKHPETIKKLMAREGVKKGENAKAQQEAIKQAVQQRAVTEAEKVAQRVADTKEEHYKMAVGLSKLIWNEIAEAKKNGKKIDTVYHSVKTLKIAAEGLKTLRDERYTILGIKQSENDDDKPLPELVIRELTKEDAKELMKRTALEAADGLDVADVDFGDAEILDDDSVSATVDDSAVEGEDADVA